MPIPFVVAVDCCSNDAEATLTAIGTELAATGSAMPLNRDTWLVTTVRYSSDQLKNLLLERIGSGFHVAVIHLVEVQAWSVTDGHPVAVTLHDAFRHT